MLLCPVRNCHKPLQLAGKQRICAAGHSFDIARSGYTNLLQPQERRSKQPGDTPEAVLARRRLHDRGFTAPLLDSIVQLLQAKPDDHVLDAGCGDGFYLGNLSTRTGCQAHGIDISIPAIDAAARRYPQCEWIVANADRFIPYADRSFSIVLSITARMNPAEFHRVLRSEGRLAIALPAPDDLVELRGAGRDRVSRTVGMFEPYFELLCRERAFTKAELSPEAVHDVLLSIYRPGVAPLRPATAVTFSFDLLLFQPRPHDQVVHLNQTASIEPTS